MNEIEYLKGSNGNGEASRATVTNARSPLASTLMVDSVTNWPNKFVATVGTLNLETQLLNPATIRVFKGHLDSGNIEIESMAPGYVDNIGNAVGDVVVLKPNTLWSDIIAESFETVGTSINGDGSLTTAALNQSAAATKTALQADTNFRTKQRVSVNTTLSTLTPDINTYSVYELNAQGSALSIANPIGTPNEKDILILFIKDNGTARAITWGTAYANISGLDSLTTTVANKWHVVGCVYNAGLAKWQIVSISTEA